MWIRAARCALAALLTMSTLAAAQGRGPAVAQPRGAAPPVGAPRGLVRERAARIDRMLDAYVRDGRVAGAVALVLRDGWPVYEAAVGWADKEAARRMQPDTLFRIASQTKALTSAAILMLVEEGTLSLGQAAGDFIPGFMSTTVLRRDANGGRVVEQATRRITIRDLLTHTSGMSYGVEPEVAAAYAAKGLGSAAGYGWYTADKDEPVCATMERLGTLPFLAQPGRRWIYGYNTDVLGCIVERASGMPLDRFLETRLTGPLGMRDTRFFVRPEDRGRLAAVYASGDDGKAVRAPDGALGQGHYVDGPRRNVAGGAGLVSTARDYARFLEMIRLGGTLDGVRYLSPRSVRLMTSNQVGELHAVDGPGLGYGLAFETVERDGASGFASVGSFGWGGAYGSVYKVDPSTGTTLLLMIQLIPNRTDIREKFQALVFLALDE